MGVIKLNKVIDKKAAKNFELLVKKLNELEAVKAVSTLSWENITNKPNFNQYFDGGVAESNYGGQIEITGGTA